MFQCSKSRSSSAPLLKHLHWLPVSARIHFKIAHLTFKSLHTIAPSYLSSLIQPYVLLRALRSTSAHQLCVLHVSSVFGSRGFRLAGPAIWNSLPLSVTSCSTIHTFKKQLKMHLFASAFPDASLIRWSAIIYLFGCSLILCMPKCMLLFIIVIIIIIIIIIMMIIWFSDIILTSIYFHDWSWVWTAASQQHNQLFSDNVSSGKQTFSATCHPTSAEHCFINSLVPWSFWVLHIV